MRLPWTKPAPVETRSASSYEAGVIALLTSQATGADAPAATATGALQACSGFIARSFAAAEIVAPDNIARALTPALLSMVGRQLVRAGEIVLLIRADPMSGLRLVPTSHYTIVGGPEESTWTYRTTSIGPTEHRTVQWLPGADVLHIRYETDPAAAWRGIGPIASARLAGKLSAATAAALADESGMAHGAFLALPVDGKDATLPALKADIRTAKGKLLTVEAGDWDKGPGGGKVASWTPQRFGSDPPAALVQLMEKASMEVFAAVGISPALFGASDGTSAREAYRQALHSVIAPLGKIVADELSRKLETEIVLDWAELRAGDIAGRARAFQSMVGGGMDVGQAAALSGLMIPDEK